MRHKYWDLAIIIIGILSLVASFTGDKSVESILGFEMNPWVYRAIWTFVVVLSLISYRKKSASESEK